MAESTKSSMPLPLRHSLALYGTGHVALLLGAWAMEASGSIWPMAFAASTSLMLTVPLVRHFLAPARPRR